MAYTDLILNGLFTGLGTGIGSYVATSYAIHHLQKAEKFIKKVNNNNKSGVDEP